MTIGTRRAITSVNPGTRIIEVGCFVMNPNVIRQRTPHNYAVAADAIQARVKSDVIFVSPSLAARDPPTLARPATPPGTRAPSRVIRRHRPARGRYTRARRRSVPIVRWQRISGVRAMERRNARECGGNPITQHQQSPIAQEIPPLPAPIVPGNPRRPEEDARCSPLSGASKPRTP